MKTISDCYKAIISNNNNATALFKPFAGLSDDQIESYKSQGYDFYRGKVRDLLIKDNRIRMIHSDRLTAFDKFIDYVPYKGVILSAISNYWLKKAEQVVPTHLISQESPRELLVEVTQPFKIEVIVRGYLAGSMARSYSAGERVFCGQKLGEGLKTYDKLPSVIITPTTKAAVFEHDENTTPEELVKNGICTEGEWQTIEKMALELFALGTELSSTHGWILVDTKYEFGKTPNGEILLIDEAHTPDSSRFWIQNSYHKSVKQNQSPEMLDKELVRKWLMQQGYQGEGTVPTVPIEVLVNLGKVYLNLAETLIQEPILCD